jgi:hypothetical protein
MRRRVIALALAAALAFPIASLADDVTEDAGDAAAAVEPEASEAATPDPEQAEPEEEASAEEEEDEEEPTAWDEYLASVGERFLTGLNGIVTAPADPPMAAVEPPEALEKAGYARHPLGFASGVLLMCYRTFSGALDFTLALFPKLPVLSPVPRYQVIPGFEHEDS